MGCPKIVEHYLEFVGRSRADNQQHILELMGDDFPAGEYMDRCRVLIQQTMEQKGVPLKPGVREILDFLRQRRIPMALATSTHLDHTLRRLELAGLDGYFKAIITGDQVEHSKPDPEIYAKACQALGTDPAHTLAVEDSRNGILSASSAGMPAVMIPDLIPATADLEERFYCKCASLLELRDMLRKAF